jgi:hypothetical protein
MVLYRSGVSRESDEALSADFIKENINGNKELTHRSHFVASLLQSAEAASPRAFADAGLNYCKGLFHFRFQYDQHQGMHYLNKARRDGKWGAAALLLMITIYVEPILDAVYDTTNQAKAAASASKTPMTAFEKGERQRRTAQYELNDNESVQIAEKLFEELEIIAGGSAPEYSGDFSGETCDGLLSSLVLSSPSSPHNFFSIHTSGQGHIRLRCGLSLLASSQRSSATSSTNTNVLCLRTLRAELLLARLIVMRQAAGAGVNSNFGSNSGGEETEALLNGITESQVSVLADDKEFVPAMLVLSIVFMLQRGQVITGGPICIHVISYLCCETASRLTPLPPPPHYIAPMQNEKFDVDRTRRRATCSSGLQRCHTRMSKVPRSNSLT